MADLDDGATPELTFTYEVNDEVVQDNHVEGRDTAGCVCAESSMKPTFLASAALGAGPAEPQRAARLPIHGQLPEQLASQYDVVLIDTPPLLPVTEAAHQQGNTNSYNDCAAGPGMRVRDKGRCPRAAADPVRTPSHPCRHAPVLAAAWPGWDH